MEKVGSSLWNCCAMTPRDLRNERWAGFWAFVWIGSWVGLNLAISYEILPRGTPGTLAVLVPLGLGVRMILAYRRFLREADELLRKIHLDALALSVGVGLVAGFTHQLLTRTGAISEADVLGAMLPMVLTYAGGVFVAVKRFS
jgi:drug/metabolite transporter (DMT)-like permease